jgi:hypothetical protein
MNYGAGSGAVWGEFPRFPGQIKVVSHSPWPFAVFADPCGPTGAIAHNAYYVNYHGHQGRKPIAIVFFGPLRTSPILAPPSSGAPSVGAHYRLATECPGTSPGHSQPRFTAGVPGVLRRQTATSD